MGRTRKIVFLLFFFIPRFIVADTVIVNPDVKVNILSSQQLRSIFTMRLTRWDSGQPVNVFTLPDRHQAHRNFVKNHLQMFPYQLRIVWDRAVFSGSGYPPTMVTSTQEMISIISRTPGAIGYIDDSSSLALQGVKVLEIQ